MELGKYAFNILVSYGATIFLIAGLIVFSIYEQRKVRKQIKDLEQKK